MTDRKWQHLLYVGVLLVASRPALAQATGSIHGLVRDASGAVIPGAKVVATNVLDGQNRTLETSERGEYFVPLLPVGDYRVEIQKAGFQNFVQYDVKVAVNTDVQVDASLVLPGAGIEITVSAAPPLIQTTTTNLVQVVGQKEMAELPLNGRNVLQLTALTPGISNDPRVRAGVIQGATVGQGFYNVVISANGARANQNSYLLDNVDNNDNYTNINAPYPNPDAVQEFSVQTSSFDAQYGRGLGAVVNVVTRSGNNSLHGSVYEFLRNYKLNARNFFTGLDTLKRSQFGGSFGGPVVLPGLYNGKNRTFFFASYQGTRQRVSTPRIATAASEAMQAGDFSSFLSSSGSGVILDPLASAPFPGNRVPQNRFDPVAKNLLAYFPSSTSSNYQLLFPTPSVQLNDNQFTARVDHNISDAQRVSFRLLNFGYDNPWVVVPNNLYYFNTGLDGRYVSAVLNHTKVITTRIVNDFNVGLHFSKALLLPPSELSNCCSLAALGSRVNTLPESETFAASITGWSGSSAAVHRDQRQITYLIADNLSLALGRHQLRLGFNAERYRIDYVTYFNASASTTFTGQITGVPGRISAANGYADFLLGRYATFRQQTVSGYRLNNNYYGLYLQDDVRLASNLTLNLGLRWSPTFFPNDSYGQNTTFIPGRQSVAFPNAPQGLLFNGDPGVDNPTVPAYWKAFAPRFGIAYQVSSRTAVRAAYGIFFDQYMMISSNRGAQAPPWVNQINLVATGTLSNPYGSGTPITLERQRPSSDATFLPYSVFAVPTQGMTPGYAQSWNAVVEHQISGDLVLKATYLGSRGSHLLIAAESNPAIYAAGASLGNLNSRRIYQPIGGLQLGHGAGWSKFQGVQLSLQKRMSKGFLLRANYAWGKSEDVASYGTIEGNNIGPDPFNWNYNRGPSDFDIPHRSTITGLFTHPSLAHRNRFIRNVLGGWQSNIILTIQSGTPLNIVSGVDNALSGVGSNFADLTGTDWKIDGDRSKADQIRRWFNPAAFRQNALGTPGNGGRNRLRVPGMWNVDYSIFKRISLKENLALECRGEFFNFFNHANLGAPNNSAVSATFAQINSAADPRIGQLSLRLVF